jgi:long-chain acyl-CoA synthetase
MLLEESMQEALRRDPAQRAIEYGGDWVTWGWLAAVADKLDRILSAAGLGENIPVGLVARNRPNFVAALLEVIGSSRSAVMIYAYQSSDALAGDVRRLQLPVVVADDEDWTDILRQAAQDTGTLGIALGGAGADEVRIVVTPDAGAQKSVRGGVETRAIEILTSGTTGAPKRLPLTYDFLARALIGESTQAARLRAGDPVDPVLMMFPFGNISGLYSYIPMAASGRPVVLLEKFSAAAWIDFVKRYRPKEMNLPPAGVRMVLNAAPPKEDLASLQYIYSGAAWLDPNVQEEFRQVFGVPILLAYGATEFGGVVAAYTPPLYQEFGPAKLTSVGRPWAGTELRIIDADSGAILPTGETGILELRTPRLGTDWVRTSDLASIDVDGFLFHRGRADGAISRGGFKIIPENVAEKLALHPAVAAAAVVGRPDERVGEVPVAVLELRPGAQRPSDAELEAHARKHLYSTHIPVAYIFVDALPRTPSLKVSIPGLKALLAEAAEPSAEAQPAQAHS